MAEYKKGVTIVTIFDHYNIGNRLQNYALQEVLKTLGLNVNTLQFIPNKITKKTRIKWFIQKICGYKLPGDTNYWKLFVPREFKFEEFNKTYIKTIAISDMSKLNSLQSDFWVVGSDQVWNILWYNDFEVEGRIFFLEFVKDSPKISYAASFGVNSIPEKWRVRLSKQLESFMALSVREESGKNILERMAGLKAEVHVDPTLLLGRKEWDFLAKKPAKVNCSKGYLLTYFLGDKSDVTKEIIHKIAKEKRLEIFNLLDFEQPDLYTVNPAEFLYLVKNARIIITDSFHACVFSFIYCKPFLVFEREGLEMDISSRIDTFIRKFHLENKRFRGENSVDLFECNYEEGYAVLEEEKRKSINYLKRWIIV